MAKNNESESKNTPKFRLGGLYVKDISFENPAAPGIFTRQTERPEMSVSIDVHLQKLKNSAYEVSLKVTARADEKGKAVFLVELTYGGLFIINPELPLEEHDKILLVDCAHVIFPFARRLVADLVQEGNFPALLLEPINFEAIYQQKRGKAA